MSLTAGSPRLTTAIRVNMLSASVVELVMSCATGPAGQALLSSAWSLAIGSRRFGLVPGHHLGAPYILETTIFGELKLVLGELFDVDVLEGDNPDVLDEPCRPVDIPDPGIGHGDVEVDLTTLAADLHVNRVGQIETALGLNDVREEPNDVAILTIELKLHLGLVLLQVL